MNRTITLLKMIYRFYSVFLFICILCTCVVSYANNSGQSHSSKNTKGAIIDDSMFQMFLESGGYYFFWETGEFATHAEEIPPEIFMGTNKTPVLKNYGTVNNEEIVLPFIITHDTRNLTFLMGVQFNPNISLINPSGNVTADEKSKNSILKTSHMLLGYIDNPEKGEWKVIINGSGKYSVTVNVDIPLNIESLIEPPSDLDPGEITNYYLEKFYALDREDGLDLIRSLPDDKMLDVAHRLLNDEDTILSYICAGILFRNGFEEEAIPVIAAIILSGEDKSSLNNRLGYDWVHSDDESLAARIIIRILEYINHHYKDLQPDEKKRAKEFFKRMGLPGEYSNEKADLLINLYNSRLQTIEPNNK